MLIQYSGKSKRSTPSLFASMAVEYIDLFDDLQKMGYEQVCLSCCDSRYDSFCLMRVQIQVGRSVKANVIFSPFYQFSCIEMYFLFWRYFLFSVTASLAVAKNCRNMSNLCYNYRYNKSFQEENTVWLLNI